MSNARELSQIATAIVVDGSKNVSVAEKITVTKDSSISGLTVGKGKGGAGDTNTVVGADIFSSSVSGNRNAAFGRYALGNLSSGSDNTGLGFAAGYQITTGTNNTSVGKDALYSNTTASNNTAVGYQAGYSNTTGASNTFVGHTAGASNTTGGGGVAVGILSLNSNTTGMENVAIGGGFNQGATLQLNTTGGFNTGVGNAALRNNTTASFNTAVGWAALYTGTTFAGVGATTAIGYNAGYTTNGYSGTFVGHNAGLSATSGYGNTFVGQAAGGSVTTGSANTILGRYNGNSGGLDIRTANGYIVLSDGDGTPRLYITGSGNVNQLFCPAVYDWTTANSANVVVTGTSGHLVRSTSALKYKQDIRDLESIDINKFRPVRYKSKSSSDDQTKDYFGFIADEVDEAGVKELVQYGSEGEVEGFSYDRMTAVLVKAVQDLKKTVEAQALEIAQLKGN